MEYKRYSYKAYEDRGKGNQYYTEPESAENWIPMGDFRPDKSGHYIEIPYCTWGDYAGDTMNRANWSEFMGYIAKDSPLVYNIWGGHNSHMIIAHEDILKDDFIREKLEGLDNYPLFNDETLSELEMQLESESWESWVKHDLKRALSDNGIEFPESDSELESLFWHCARYNNIEPVFEDAVSCHWRIDDIVELWGNGFCNVCNSPLMYKGDKCKKCHSCGHEFPKDSDQCPTCEQMF